MSEKNAKLVGKVLFLDAIVRNSDNPETGKISKKDYLLLKRKKHQFRNRKLGKQIILNLRKPDNNGKVRSDLVAVKKSLEGQLKDLIEVE